MSQSSLAINITVQGVKQAESLLKSLKQGMTGAGSAAAKASRAAKAAAEQATAALSASEKEAKRFERAMASLDKRAELAGRKGGARVEAQRDQFIKLNQAAIDTPEKLAAVHRAFDRIGASV